jgi:hypothetical protein
VAAPRGAPPYDFNSQQLNWKTSIVDLLKLLGLDSSLPARKGLATELGCPVEKLGGSAEMNIWLHKTVRLKLAANGGNIPKELMHQIRRCPGKLAGLKRNGAGDNYPTLFCHNKDFEAGPACRPVAGSPEVSNQRYHVGGDQPVGRILLRKRHTPTL